MASECANLRAPQFYGLRLGRVSSSWARIPHVWTIIGGLLFLPPILAAAHFYLFVSIGSLIDAYKLLYSFYSLPLCKFCYVCRKRNSRVSRTCYGLRVHRMVRRFAPYADICCLPSFSDSFFSKSVFPFYCLPSKT